MIERSRLLDWFLLVSCNLIWASQFAMVKLVQEQVGPIAATLLPMTLATILLVPIVMRERRAARTPRSLAWSDLGRFALLGVMGQVVAQLCITWGMRFSTASNAALLMLMLPVVTAFMARVILGEHMTPVRWVSFGLAIVGALACSGIDWASVDLAGDGSALTGTALVVLSIGGSAFYNVYSKSLLGRYSPLEVLLYSYFAVLACLFPIAWSTEPVTLTQMASYTPRTLVGIGVLAVFQYAVSMVAFLWVLRRLEASQASLGNYLIPFFGLVIAAILLDERLEWYMVLGGALVLASTILATLGDARAAEETRAGEREWSTQAAGTQGNT
jgi:drug/metabolite transporter (DMT)-like permease